MESRYSLSKQIYESSKEIKQAVLNNVEGDNTHDLKVKETKEMQQKLNDYFDNKSLNYLKLLSRHLEEESINLCNYCNSDIAFSEIDRVAKLLIVNSYLTKMVKQKIDFITNRSKKINLL